MKAYSIIISRSALKQLQMVQKNMIGRITKQIDLLAINPRPDGVKSSKEVMKIYIEFGLVITGLYI